MSYCRFSSDDFQCDAYCFEHCGGWFQIYVAGNKAIPCEPLPPRVELTRENIPAYMARSREVDRILDASPRKAIGLPHDGEEFREADASACADRLEYLRGLGYSIPQYAIDALREEAANPVAE